MDNLGKVFKKSIETEKKIKTNAQHRFLRSGVTVSEGNRAAGTRMVNLHVCNTQK